MLVSVIIYAHNGQNKEAAEGQIRMKTLSAKEAKYLFGRLIDAARAEPVVVAKHGRPVVVVMAVEAYEHLIGNRIMAATRNETVTMSNKNPTSMIGRTKK